MPTLTIDPSSKSLRPGETCQFTAVREPAATGTVTWAIESPAGGSVEGLGSISAGGLYTAPETIPAAPSADVRATADGETATARVDLVPVAEPVAPVEAAGPKAEARPLTIQVVGSPLGAGQIPVLGASQTVTLHVPDSTGKSLPTTRWELAGAEGLSPELVGKIDASAGPTATYTAPGAVTVQRYVAIAATTASGQAAGVIALAPGKVTIIPGEVELHSDEAQHFLALVSGDDKGDVQWAPVSSEMGTLDQTGLYTAPKGIKDDRTVTITAISKVSRDQGHARISLLPDPWQGKGVNWLGAWLFVLFLVPVSVTFLWPPPIDRSKLNTAMATARSASSIREQREAALKDEEGATSRIETQLAVAEKATPPSPAALEALRQAKKDADGKVREKVTQAAEAKRDAADKAAAVTVEEQAIEQAKKDEIRLLTLVIMAGALGSFIHLTRSFVDFVGNRTIRASWVWWYLLQPLTGSALAAVVYLVIRGGFFAGASLGTNLNPHAFVAMGTLVGLFSKQAVNKLDELFTTLFKTDKERELKDKLDPRRPPTRGTQ